MVSFVSVTVLLEWSCLPVAQSLVNFSYRCVYSSNFLVQAFPVHQQLDLSVLKTAKQITVRIFTNPGAGSGVIVGRRGKIYTVLTNRHVVADSVNHNYRVLTIDGLMHPAEWLHSVEFKDTDLALVRFTSKKAYVVAAINDSTRLSPGDPIYAAGFYNWHYLNANAIESTSYWGLRAFRFTTGKMEMLLARPLSQGYGLGYTNEVENGMSGGPVLNRDGQLVGINGRLKYPFQGIRAFTFIDGTIPSPELFQQMESLSWAIPSATFQQMIE
ncbi:serine protease [Nostoc sp. NMS8]|uniref:S1 family peptidase n=1 Tax=Nostoc sp. NMS8 TaxID=2815392 RepID=UPI0025E016A3|nr:serine protease [Nostoc sp. NMS8]